MQRLLISSRNLEFFTNGYRYLIQILPAAVVAPMYFSGKIEFGVINQSVSAFNHILGDFSLIVYQFQAISAFSAVIDRLGTVFFSFITSCITRLLPVFEQIGLSSEASPICWSCKGSPLEMIRYSAAIEWILVCFSRCKKDIGGYKRAYALWFRFFKLIHVFRRHCWL